MCVCVLSTYISKNEMRKTAKKTTTKKNIWFKSLLLQTREMIYILLIPRACVVCALKTKRALCQETIKKNKNTKRTSAL